VKLKRPELKFAEIEMLMITMLFIYAAKKVFMHPL